MSSRLNEAASSGGDLKASYTKQINAKETITYDLKSQVPDESGTSNDHMESQHAPPNSSANQSQVQAKLWRVYLEYCRLPVGPSRVWLSKDSPKMTLSQFVKLCQEVGLGAPQGSIELHLMQIIYASYKPLGSSTISFPEFSTALAAVSKESKWSQEELDAGIDLLHEKVGERHTLLGKKANTQSPIHRPFSRLISHSCPSPPSQCIQQAPPEDGASPKKPQFAPPQRQWTPSSPSLHHRAPNSPISSSRRMDSQPRRETGADSSRPFSTSSIPLVPTQSRTHTTTSLGYINESPYLPGGSGGPGGVAQNRASDSALEGKGGATSSSTTLPPKPSSMKPRLSSPAVQNAVTIEAWPEYRASNSGAFVSLRAYSPSAASHSRGSILGDSQQLLPGEMPPWAFALAERVRWLEQQHQAEKDNVYSTADRAKAK